MTVKEEIIHIIIENPDRLEEIVDAMQSALRRIHPPAAETQEQ